MAITSPTAVAPTTMTRSAPDLKPPCSGDIQDVSASAVLFIGPSLPPAEAAQLLEADVSVRPPARRGDFEELSPAVNLVAVVDGVFFADQAVSPREILGALRRGVRVLGASSMGALRAAELDSFGMEGLGEVYRMYADGELTSDADVALAFDPETGRAITEPVVNIVQMTRLAVAAAVLEETTAHQVVEMARSIYFTDLTYPALFEALSGTLPAAILDRFVSFADAHRREGDIKRSDALLAIARLSELLRSVETQSR
jgi:hypothetical protein